MISSGYFGVTKDVLFHLTKKQALEFVFEMFSCGSRIGHHEYCQWVKFIEEYHSRVLTI